MLDAARARRACSAPDEIASARTAGPSRRRRPARARTPTASTSSPTCTPPAPPACRSSARRRHDYFARLAAAMAGALDLTPGRPGARAAAAVPHQPDGLRHHHRAAHRRRRAHRRRSSRRAASGPRSSRERVTVLILHAPPVEILKRATTADDAAGHRVRTMFYADREFLHRFGVPAAVSGYGSTEAGGVSHLHRWSATDDIPDDASRHGGAGARGHRVAARRATASILVREREHAALFDGYVTRRRARPGPRRRRLVRHRRPRPRRRRRTTSCSSNAPPSRSGSRASSCRSRSSRTTWPRVDGIADHALWKRKGALVDDEVVLYAVADPLPLDELRARIAELPAFMRPAAVARVAALPRDAAAGKVQRRLLDRPAGARVGRARMTARRCPTGPPTWPTCTCTPRPACCRATATTPQTVARRARGRLRHRRAQVARGQHRRARRDRSATACTAASCSTARSAARTPTRSRSRPGSAAGWCGCRPCPRRNHKARRVVARSCRCTAASNSRAGRRRRRGRPAAARRGTTCSTSSPRTTCCWPAVTCPRPRPSLLFTEARRRGVQRLLVNHPLMAFLHWNDEAARGAAGARRRTSSSGILPDLLGDADHASLNLTRSYPASLLVFGGDLGHAAPPRPGRRGRAVAARPRSAASAPTAPPRS